VTIKIAAAVVAAAALRRSKCPIMVSARRSHLLEVNTKSTKRESTLPFFTRFLNFFNYRLRRYFCYSGFCKIDRKLKEESHDITRKVA
jgi:hypothetical protein